MADFKGHGLALEKLPLIKEVGFTSTITVPFCHICFLQAAKRIENYTHVTPVQTCRSIDDLAGAKLFFKCENFQKTGAFKARGASNAILKGTSKIVQRLNYNKYILPHT